MGTYLSTPNTDKESESGQTADGWAFGVSSMQGWRRSQEDAHIVQQLPNGTNVFGVFDGHGGREVSNFTKAHFGEALTQQQTYSDDVGAALRGAFHRIDELLEDHANLPEVHALKKDPRDGEDETPQDAGSSSSSAGAAASAPAEGEGEDGEEGKKVSMAGTCSTPPLPPPSASRAPRASRASRASRAPRAPRASRASRASRVSRAWTVSVAFNACNTERCLRPCWCAQRRSTFFSA